MAVMRFGLALVLCGAAAAGAPAAETPAEPAPTESAPAEHAAEMQPAMPSFTGQIAVVSDYVYRGVSYSDGHPALQASVSWSNTNGSLLTGLHIDGWGSTVDYGRGDPASTEFSATVGYYGGGDTLNYDVGVTYTVYPGVPSALAYSYGEGYVTVGTKIGTVTLSATGDYSPDYSSHTGKPWFAELDGEMPLFTSVKLTMSTGYAALPRTAGEKYAYWGAGLETDVRGLIVGLRYAGTDLAGCCNSRVVASIAKSF